MSAGPERLVLLPAGIEADIANLSGPDGYLADIVSLPPELLDDFRQRHGPLLLKQRPGFELCPRLDPCAEFAWNVLLNSLRADDAPEMSTHHAFGALLALALAGQVEPLLRPASGTVTEQVRHLLLLDPAAGWSVDMAARRLNQGASTLRCHLATFGAFWKTCAWAWPCNRCRTASAPSPTSRPAAATPPPRASAPVSANATA
nr:hypothetical protein [Chromobacterium sphagni]